MDPQTIYETDVPSLSCNRKSRLFFMEGILAGNSGRRSH